MAAHSPPTVMPPTPETAEHRRLNEPPAGVVPQWTRWACYVADRAWGTVREDYSADGDAWNSFTHDQARSRAYRWGEDAIAGLCDRYQLLVFAPAFWNGRDPILKERFFGLTSSEGNRGEDVKEYYFYLDNTPTHSYMRMPYKYPQGEYPYAALVDENRRRGGRGFEFELLDTGLFDDDRYFDIVIEYAKASPEDLCPQAVWGPQAASASPFVKDAFHRHVVHGEPAVNPARIGTKACVHYRAVVPARGSAVWRLRLTPARAAHPLDEVDAVVAGRRAEADDFYAAVHPPRATGDERLVQRQALAGMLWTKAIYLFDVAQWLDGDHPGRRPPESRRGIRNAHWRHLNSMRILSLPDKWEYPWFAAWDLAFPCVTLALVDPGLAKQNLWLLLFEQFQHPDGQLPSYEWEFSDLNPPVHAWACWRVYSLEKERTGRGDRQFLERAFHKLLINFTWWVNKVDSQGLSVFEGGFLGLDNITVVDRSDKLPGGAILEQSDATGWMGFFCLCLMRIALELAHDNRTYETMATKFFEHFVYIGGAMKKMGGRDYQLWDDADGFFYDVLRYPDGRFHKFAVRSLVGLIPLYAIEIIDECAVADLPAFLTDINWFIRNRPDLVGQACFTDRAGGRTRHVLSIVDRHQLEKLLQRIWDPDEFLSEAGIRSLSKHHERAPFEFDGRAVRYEPAEADVKIKGGNSNWRGPIWFPTSFLLLEALVRFDEAYRSGLAILAPGPPDPVTPRGIGQEIADRLIGLFTRGADGRRRIYGGAGKFQADPHWRDCLLFHEYFRGDNGAGLGASHQTGWTGLVANLIDEWRR